MEEMLNKYSKQTQEYILMFIEAFTKAYGEFITKEELLKRITNGLDSDIEFVDDIDGGKSSGAYNPKTKTIEILKANKDSKNVIIHEFIHCISRYEDEYGNIECGFEKIFKIEDSVYIIEGTGVDEGTVDYMTQEICQVSNFEYSSGYKKLNCIIKHLIYFTGKDRLIGQFLSPNNDISEMLQELGIDADRFTINLDMVCEQELSNKTILDTTNIDLQYFVSTLEDLAKIYPSATSQEELIEKYKFFKSLCSQLYAKDEYNIYVHLIEDIRNLRSRGINLSKISFMLEDEDVKQTCKLDKHIEEVMKKRKDEIVLNLEDTLFGADSENAEQSIAQRIFPYLFYKDEFKKEDFDRFYELISVQEYLRQHPEIDYREISFKVYDDMDLYVACGVDGRVLNIYDFEMSKSLKQVESQVEGVASEIFIDEQGTLLYFDDDDVLHYGDMQLRDEEEYRPSILENAENDILEKQFQYEEMKRIDTPEELLKKQQLLIKRYENRLTTIETDIQESKARRIGQYKTQDKDDDNER